jgi:NAD(P)-dependent dehydrogenase (short-subunit alcohol dehydrogenase family)
MMNPGSPPTVVVTGASSGIGQAIATTLHEAGWRVIGTSRSEQPASQGYEMRTLDVTDQGSIEQFIRAATAEAPIAALVNNAGVIQLGHFEVADPQQCEQALQTNLHGPMRMMHAVGRHMLEQGSGRIINIGSLAGRIPVPGQSVYTASKFGLRGLSHSLYHEWRPHGVEVTLLEVGFVATPLHEHGPEPAEADATIHQALAQQLTRGLPPERVAQQVASLLKRRRMPPTVRVGIQAKLLPLIHAVTAKSLYGRILRRKFGL